MPPIEVKVPDIGDFKNVPVIEILVKPGDTVKADDPLVSLESDKATMEVPAPAAGKVVEILVKIGDKVSEGSAIVQPWKVLPAPEPAAAEKPAAASARHAAAPPPAATAAAATTEQRHAAVDGHCRRRTRGLRRRACEPRGAPPRARARASI